MRGVLRQHGMDQTDYLVLLVKQKERCAICRRPSKTRLGVDHDHKTGRVRGLLCCACNQGIGYLRDSPRLLMQAIAYLSPRA